MKNGIEMSTQMKTVNKKLKDYVIINPKEVIAPNKFAKKVAMEKLQPFCRDIVEYELCEYKGGTKFRNGDTIMARITPCLENGKTAKVNFLDNGEVGFGSTEYIVFRAKEEIMDADFLYYLIISPLVRETAIKSMVGSSGRQRVQTDVVANIEIEIPSLLEQKKVANIMKVLDDKIALNTAINKNLEEQAQALYDDLFADVSFDATLADLGTVVGGSTPSKKHSEYYTDQGIAWITPKDLSNDSSKFIYHGENDITELGLSKCSATVMPIGTVLFSSRAPIGYIAIAANPMATNQGFKSVIPSTDIGTAFIYYFLKNNLTIIESMASGSTFKEISAGAMKTVPAFKPDSDKLCQFRNFCEPLFCHQQLLESENARLAQLRDTLLPRLMSGEIDVSEMEV